MDDLCKIALDAVLDKKAVNTVVIDISGISLMADYMLICSGNSRTHVKGIANSVIEKIKENNLEVFNTSGKDTSEWILVDLGNVIVHIMLESLRNFYTLEKLWGHGKILYSDENIVETSR